MKIAVEKRSQMGQESNNEQQFIRPFGNGLIFRKVNNKLRSVLTIVMTIGVAVIIISCNSPSDKLDNAEKDKLKAEQSLAKVNVEYLAEVENYRVETRDRIEANNQRITKLKTLTEGDKIEGKVHHKKEIYLLEQKNTNLKKRMDNYKVDTKENWEEFKTKFNRDMDELGSALKNFVTESK
jgi:hypothetical protein